MKRSKFSLVILPSITIASPALNSRAGYGSSLGRWKDRLPRMAILRIACYRELGILRIRNEPDTLPLSPLPPHHRLRACPHSISCSPCFRLQPFQHHGDDKKVGVTSLTQQMANAKENTCCMICHTPRNGFWPL